MRTKSTFIVVLAVASFGSLQEFPEASAATITVSNTQPTPDADDISNFIGSATAAGNVGVQTGEDQFDAIYTFSDRPAQGQTFTTGPNPVGYTLSSVTVHAAEHYGATTFILRVVNPSDLSVPLLVETPPNPGTINFGDYLTFNLTAPLPLLPNTTYGFDVGTPTGGMMFSGTDTDAYPGGVAYSSGDNGVGTVEFLPRTGDRVFLASLDAVPEPGSIALLALASASLLRRRRA